MVMVTGIVLPCECFKHCFKKVGEQQPGQLMRLCDWKSLFFDWECLKFKSYCIASKNISACSIWYFKCLSITMLDFVEQCFAGTWHPRLMEFVFFVCALLENGSTPAALNKDERRQGST